jgi:glycerol uptake facilitator-like aquaporin
MTVMRKDVFQCALVEAVGTFLLALAVFQSGEPLAVGLILMAALYLGTHAHVPFLNTAVGFAAFFNKKIDLNAFVVTSVAQVIGALGAGMLSARMSNAVPVLPMRGLPMHMGLAEAIATFVFVMVVMTMVSNIDRLKNSDLYGLVIGLTATGLIYVTKGLAFFNPAIALGIMLHNYMVIVPEEGVAVIEMPHLAIFVIVPFIGSVLAVWFYDYIQGMKK